MSQPGAEAANRAFWARKVAEARAADGSVEFDVAEVPRAGSDGRFTIGFGEGCGLLLEAASQTRLRLTVIP